MTTDRWGKGRYLKKEVENAFTKENDLFRKTHVYKRKYGRSNELKELKSEIKALKSKKQYDANYNAYGSVKKMRYGSPEYWKSADAYEFDIKGGKSKLSVFAHSERAAKLKATNWEKWLRKRKR